MLTLCLVGLLAGLSPASQMKQSMQETAATTDQSNALRENGAKYKRHDELLGEVGLGRKSLKANVFFFSSKFRVSVSMHVYYIRTYIF